MKNSSASAHSLHRTHSSVSSGHRSERGLLLSLPSWQGSPSDLKPWQKSSSSSQVNEIMTRATQLLERMLWFWIILLLVSVGQVIWWALDREPPFKVKEVRVTNSAPGGVVHVDAEVFRDMSRDCGVTVSTHLYDATGARFTIDATQIISCAGVAAIERKTPGKLRRTLQIPMGAAPGPASLVSSMSYTCNPLQELMRPIHVQTEFQFEVLP